MSTDGTDVSGEAGVAGETGEAGDVWSNWLLRDRHGDDPAYRQSVMAAVTGYRDKVLDGAKLAPEMTLLDVGTGDGLVAFGAIDRVGPALRVILADVSAPLIKAAERTAERRGVRGQCAFLQASADRLAGVADASVDVVTTRAVLAYVVNKRRAFAEFRRVLRPGGRVSLCEPVAQDQAFETLALGQMLDASPGHPDADHLRLLHRLLSAQYPATEAEILASPLTNYSERDLIGMAREAGFKRIHAELHIDDSPSHLTSWEAFLGTSPHPWSPTVSQILSGQFTAAERDQFEARLRPQIDAGSSDKGESVVYLTAERPPD